MKPRDARIILDGNPESILMEAEANTAGEILRAATFPIEDEVGCYTTFETRPDVEPVSDSKKRALASLLWPSSELNSWADEDIEEAFKRGTAFSFQEGPVTVECFYYWDGDGTLLYLLTNTNHNQRVLCNCDCKKDYVWNDFDIPVASSRDLAPVDD